MTHSPLLAYWNERERILASSPRIPTDPAEAVHAVREQRGVGGAKAWASEVAAAAGVGVPTAEVVALAAVAGLAQEAAETRSLRRRAELLLDIERRVSAVVGRLVSGGES